MHVDAALAAMRICDVERVVVCCEAMSSEEAHLSVGRISDVLPDVGREHLQLAWA